jgi:hypothetical protein
MFLAIAKSKKVVYYVDENKRHGGYKAMLKYKQT